jgi:hypothetical protein
MGIRECLLSFGAEYFVFQFAVHKKKEDLTELHFCLLFCVAVKLVSHIEGQHRLRVLENRVLRRIFGSQREEVTRDWESA